MTGSTGDYLNFLLPGILVMAVTMVTMYTGMDRNNDISKGIFDRFRTLPRWNPYALIGSLLVDTIRYTLASTIIIVLRIVLGYRPDGGIPGVLLGVALLLVFCFSLSWKWTTLGLIDAIGKVSYEYEHDVTISFEFCQQHFCRIANDA